MKDQIAGEIAAILGYTCETQAPNSLPTTEYITDRWMRPRRDDLVEYVRERMERAWDQGHRASERDWEFLYDPRTPDELKEIEADRQPWTNPYRKGGD